MTIIIFLDLFLAIVKIFKYLEGKIPQLSAKATNVLNSIEKSSFVVACCVIEKFAGLILLFSKLVQNSNSAVIWQNLTTTIQMSSTILISFCFCEAIDQRRQRNN